ncbi:hypothetical protein HYZ76_00795 [Candidatus Falkowbacteria bacterium]|nr:hypothetical protein [Candidatus Falkowbacteria bacterium]
MASDTLKNKRVLIFQQRSWGLNLGHFLAKKLQKQGCRLGALTFKKSTHQFTLEQKEVNYDFILSNDEVMGRPKDYLAGDKFSLEKICEDLGIASIWPIAMSLRNHVRSYKDKYYYGFKQNVSDEEIIDFIMAVYKYIVKTFKDFNPEVIITPNFVSFPHIIFNLYAKKMGVKMIGVTDSKVGDIRIFTYSFNDDEGPFYDHLDKLNLNQVKTENSEKAREYIARFREKFSYPQSIRELKNKKTFIKKIRHQLSPYYHILRWYIEKPINVIESTGITYDYRPPRIILRDFYTHKKNQKFMAGFDYYPFAKIEKFVYFPLQFQPEASIDVAAPYFSNQIETARQLAMSLPADYTLVVKEHPTMVGLRSPSYIEKIARTVNVKLIDYRVPSEEVLKKAALVVSPNSTTLAEAAFLNLPAIQLGNLGTTSRLPNVFKHTDMTTIAKKIKEIIAAKLTTDEYEQRLENYVAAAYDKGFDVDYLASWQRGEGDMEQLWRIYKKEIETILS